MKKLSLFVVLGMFWGVLGQAQSGPPPPYPPADQNIPLDPDGPPKPIKEVHRSIAVDHGELKEGPAVGKKTKMPLPPPTVMQPE